MLASAQPYPPGSDGSACERATEPSGDRLGRDGTGRCRTTQKPCPVSGLRESPAEPLGAALPAQPAPPPGSGSGQAAAALGWAGLRSLPGLAGFSEVFN